MVQVTRRKHKLAFVVFFGVVTVLALLYYLPIRPFISQSADISIIELHVNEYDYNSKSYIEVPISLDDSYALTQTVKNIRCNRIHTGMASYSEKLVKYKIYCICDQKSIYILLGELNIIYTPGTSVLNQRSYQIANADEILAEVNHLIENTR